MLKLAKYTESRGGKVAPLSVLKGREGGFSSLVSKEGEGGFCYKMNLNFAAFAIKKILSNYNRTITYKFSYSLCM